MDSPRRTALVAGLFYLITFAAPIPAVFLLAPVLNHTGCTWSARVLAVRLRNVSTAWFLSARMHADRVIHG